MLKLNCKSENFKFSLSKKYNVNSKLNLFYTQSYGIKVTENSKTKTRI